MLLCDFDDAESNRKPFPCRCDSNPCQLTEISPDSYKWSPMHGKTPSDATGPDYDHTQQNDNGQYIYAEASQIVPGSVAQIQTPSFQLGTTSCLTFYYHMFGQHIGSLVVSAMFTNGSYGTLYTLDGEQGEVWLPATVILPENVNRVTFKATRGGTSQGQPFGDIALDDVKIIRQLCPGLTTSTTTTTISSTTSTTPTTSTSISRSTTPSTTTSSTTIPTTRTSVVTRSTTNPITRSSSTTTTKTTSTTTNTSSTTASPVSSTGECEQ
ncbi:hypothetical protein LSH36_13g18012 [Paralvinella palmiformis]|uniref:MAM domain-containing protein n=1 Tax=Paralvinella palmiformis TaxID=53620 RepID=A0AAD9KEE1_9ANNE|nr:hypothetical protein LSH36_13g18012 [Paralvinella palmiformis]